MYKDRLFLDVTNAMSLVHLVYNQIKSLNVPLVMQLTMKTFKMELGIVDLVKIYL